MYIENLTDKEIKEIFTKLLLIAEVGDTQKVMHYLEDCRIDRKEKNYINIFFKVNKEDSICAFSDYSAYVYNPDPDYINEKKEIKNAYRKHMYKKFGNEYYEDMRDHYKRKILAKCDKELGKLSNELNEMIKED